MSLALCVERQAAAVRMFLSLLRLSLLAFDLGERYVQRLVPEADSDDTHWRNLGQLPVGRLYVKWTAESTTSVGGIIFRASRLDGLDYR